MRGNRNNIIEGLSKKVNEARDGFEQFKKMCQENDTYKKAKSICKKFGFDAAELCYVTDYGDIRFNIITDSKKMQPDIYYDKDYTDGFRIQTAAYGALSLDKYKDFMDACDKAYSMCKELSKLDMSTLCKEEDFNKKV